MNTAATKVTTITITISDDSHRYLAPALSAAMAPFGSLDINELADAMVDFLAMKQAEKAVMIGSLYAMLASTSESESSLLIAGPFEVGVVTPTSRTKIHLKRMAGIVVLSIDFGAGGSTTRAESILEGLAEVGIPQPSCDDPVIVTTPRAVCTYANLDKLSFVVLDSVHGDTTVDVMLAGDDGVRLEWTAMAHGHACEDVEITVPRSLRTLMYERESRGCPLPLSVVERAVAQLSS